MAEPAARLLCDARAAIGEAPVWHDGTVAWTDPVDRALLYFDGDLRRRSVDRAVWSLAALSAARLAGTRDDSFCMIDSSGALRDGPVAQLDAGCRFNDMAVDRAGGLWAGVMHRGLLAARGALYHAPTFDTAPTCVARGLGVPNGMKFSADGATLFVVDTLARTLLAYPVANGLGEPVVLSDFMNVPGKPDGMALAPDGVFHVAMWGGGCIAHIAADGATLGWTKLPASHVSSVCLAGSDRLLVTTSRMRLAPSALVEQPSAGGLFEVRLK